MPVFGPIKRKDLIKALRKAGFEGPMRGGNHQYMVKGKSRLIIPNPHRGEISRGFLNALLKQASISRDEWEAL